MYRKNKIIYNVESIKKKHWSEEDLTLLSKNIDQNRSIREIAQHLNRSEPAITTKGNGLGYGYYTDRVTGLKYFKNKINHKKRRTKVEILEGKEFVSVATDNKKSCGTDIEVVIDIIAQIFQILHKYLSPQRRLRE